MFIATSHVIIIMIITESNRTCYESIHTSLHTAPGLVQSLRVSSVNVTNITIQWDRVNCQQRNGPTSGYGVRVTGPGVSVFSLVSGTSEENRVFSITGLAPRTSYTFEIQAVSSIFGEAASLTVNTSAPHGEIYHSHAFT